MATIMDRKSAEFWWKGVEIPKNVAYFKKDIGEKWNAVTWEDIHAQRTQKILANVSQKRRYEEIKPCLVWVFSHGYWLMGGYYTIIKTIDKEFYLNFRGIGISNQTNEDKLRIEVMQCFPLCFPAVDFFYDWMIEFCKKYNNSNFYQGWESQGVAKAYCKLDIYGNLSHIALTSKDL